MANWNSHSTLRRGCILCLASLGLTACIQAKLPELKADIPPAWRHASSSDTANSEQSSLDIAKSDTTKTAAANVQWWQVFQDALLNEIVQTALKQNLSLQQATERISFARAMQQHELASEKPQVALYAGPNNLSRALTGFNSGNANQSQPVSSGAYLAGFDLFWELPFFGLGPGQRQVTQADLQISQAELSIKQISLVSEIVRVYAELNATVQRDKQLGVTQSNYEKLKAFSAKGVAHGLLAPDAVESLAEEIHATQRLRRQNHIQQEIALQKLAMLCGQNAPQETWLTQLASRSNQRLSEAEKSFTLPVQLPVDVIRQRPDIKLAESQVLKAAGALGIANSELYPKLTIEGAFMVAGNIRSDRFNHNGKNIQFIRYIAPAVRIPLLDWGLRREMANQRESQLREALLAYKEAVILAVEETENALVTFNHHRAQLLADDAELNRREMQSIKHRRAANSGYFSPVDLVKQDIKNQQIWLQYIDAKQAWMQGFAHANKALSGTFDTTDAPASQQIP